MPYVDMERRFEINRAAKYKYRSDLNKVQNERQRKEANGATARRAFWHPLILKKKCRKKIGKKSKHHDNETHAITMRKTIKEGSDVSCPQCLKAAVVLKRPTKVFRYIGRKMWWNAKKSLKK